MHYNPENEENIQNCILGVFAGSTVDEIYLEIIIIYLYVM